jgi:hypothetical protein
MTEQQREVAVRREEEGIIEEHEGSRAHVNGRYYANASDADRQRRLEAERRVRREERMEGICAWCNIAFKDDDARIPAVGRFIHPKPCADEFNKLCEGMGGVELPPDEVRAIAEWQDGPTDTEIEEGLGGTTFARSA